MIDSLHILPSTCDRHAGLSAAVTGLVDSQRSIGLFSELLAADQFRLGFRSHSLLAETRLLNPPILHSHGLWLSPSCVSRAWRRSGAATVVSPHGMLDRWAWRRHFRFKQLLWMFGEGDTLRNASCLHALCPAEAHCLRELGLLNPIAVIANGVVRPDRSQKLPPPPWAHSIDAGTPVLLFLGRFHRKKGVDVLLEAWRRLQQQHTDGSRSADWWLVFAGFGDDGSLVDQLQRDPPRQCLALGPLFGSARDSAYAHAHAFVLPSFSEGLPLAALEAMSWGLPCLMTHHCNLPEAFNIGAALPVEPEPVQLTNQLRQLCSSSVSELAAMGRAGEALVSLHYRWQDAASRCRSLYQWLLGGGEPPSFLFPVG